MRFARAVLNIAERIFHVEHRRVGNAEFVEVLDHFLARVLLDPVADDAVDLDRVHHPRGIIDELGIRRQIFASDRFGQAQPDASACSPPGSNICRPSF